MKLITVCRLLVFPLVLASAACGGGGGGGDTPGAPVADAGVDQVVASGASVELSGLASTDEDGGIVSYTWTQKSGTPVTLANSGDAIATFTAPVVDTEVELSFELVVVDTDDRFDADTITVTVSPDIAPPSGFARLATDAHHPLEFTVSGGKVFFTSEDDIDSPLTAPQRDRVWVSDGTADSTRMVIEMIEDGGGYVRILGALNGGVIFSGSDSTRSEALWFTDGTDAGTYMIKDINQGGSENIIAVGVGGDYLYFTANDGVHGRELWASNGTEAGTHLIADVNTSGDFHVGRPEVATYWNGEFYFYGWYYDTSYDDYPVLYKTDGSPGNLVTLATTDIDGAVLLDFDMIVYKERLYFTWQTMTEGEELWVTDGTPGGTGLFVNLRPDVSGYSASGWPAAFHILDGALLFFAYDGSTGAGRVLWRSDGSISGTTVVYPVDAGVGMENMVLMDGKYYFPGRETGILDGWNLWVTDGTAAGTKVVSSVVELDTQDFETRMVVMGNKLVFKGTDGVHGYEPWVSNGTAAGTFMLKDIHPETGSFTSGGGEFVAVNDKAYFIAGIGNTDFQLFETDGTSEGTIIIMPDDATVTTNPLGWEVFIDMSELPVPTRFNDTLIFNANFHGGNTAYRY